MNDETDGLEAYTLMLIIDEVLGCTKQNIMALLGSVSDMINRMRDNEALRKARHDRNHKIRDSYSEKINRENNIA